MTDFIRENGLLPAKEIDEIIAMAPAALLRFQDAEGNFPIRVRAELSAWLKFFDANDRRMFDAIGEPAYYDCLSSPRLQFGLQAAA